MKKIAGFLICILLVSLCGCSLIAPAATSRKIEYEYARIENMAIVSQRFNFRLPIPEGWRRLNDQEMEEMRAMEQAALDSLGEAGVIDDAALETATKVLEEHTIIIKNPTTGDMIHFQFCQTDGTEDEQRTYAEVKQTFEKSAMKVGNLVPIQYAGATYQMFLMNLAVPEANLYQDQLYFIRCEGQYAMLITGSTTHSISNIYEVMRGIEALDEAK